MRYNKPHFVHDAAETFIHQNFQYVNKLNPGAGGRDE
jgi:hypothetical protein